MAVWTFGKDDQALMEDLGITEAQARFQMEMFQRASPYVRLHRPCTLGNGIQTFSSEELDRYVRLQEAAAGEGRFMKFVPASGAATRMFQTLFRIYHQETDFQSGAIHDRAGLGDQEAVDFLRFQERIRQFAFYEDLEALLAQNEPTLDTLIKQGRWRDIIEYLVYERGLNYGALPKGLLMFHRYEDGSRTSFEEHLAEAVHTIRDRAGICRLHFTVSPEHEEAFRRFLGSVKPLYERDFQCQLEVAFSLQKNSTCTLAVDPENRPFREMDGRLHFRPGGHGALLQNLNDLKGDLVYLKNIDNAVPDRLKGPVIFWEKVLGGILVETQAMANLYARRLLEEKKGSASLEEALAFVRDRLLKPVPEYYREGTTLWKRNFLLDRLNRPLRVCGVVKNQGEPGGAPFWVEGKGGALSLQIVEQAQVDFSSPGQQTIWASSTHFNPVDLVCAVRDYDGKPFNLNDFVNSEAVIISKKSKEGREFKSLEWPGLWNGSMAEWITLFVEVPVATFNPVKTINDLLRPEHQP